MPVWIKHTGKTIDLFSERPRGRLLDFPAGRGGQSRHLIGLGYRVVSADLFPKSEKGDLMSWVTADANQAFPFRDDTFDYILSREGIEHLEHQAFFVRDCARILKPGGELVLTTPNIMQLRARVSYFLIGQRTLRRGLVNETQTLRASENGRNYHGHAFLIDYFRLRYLLRLAGFDHIRVFTDQYSPSSLWLSWLSPICLFASKMAIAMSNRTMRRNTTIKKPDDAVVGEMLGHIFSPALLFGKRMIVVARKASLSR